MANGLAIAALGISILTAGCIPRTTHVWEPGPAATDNYEVASAKCRLVMRHENRGYSSQTTFGDCMIASGWHEMEPAKPDNVAATCNTQLAQLVEAIKPLHYSEKEMEEILAGCVREIRQ